MDDAGDKQWATKYLLDPLTAPEPSQETGPGSSFINPLRRSLSTTTKPTQQPESPRSHKKHSSYSSRHNYSGYPTPPSSASPNRSSFHPSNPFSDDYRQSLSPELSPSNRNSLRRSGSVNREGYQLQESYYTPQNSGLGRSKTVHHSRSQTQHNWHDSGLSRSASVSTGQGPDKGKGLRRSGSLSQRYPGDMSHRPLDIIKQEQRTADRAPHLRTKKYPTVDLIDSLDATAIGGAYHHGGPYDATLASRNMKKKYSPVDAVHDTNMEAIRATPKEYVQDSLVKHVPLQGTSTVPPGMTDLSGRVMNYDEGADLMREKDAAGGAYKRWDFIPYRDDDLKGKGEPSYTIEERAKEQEARQRQHISFQPGEYEMQPGVNGHGKNNSVKVRQRAVSAAGAGPSSPVAAAGPSSPTAGMSTNNDLRRSNTTGKRLSDGLKRRFGSIRRKKSPEEA